MPIFEDKFTKISNKILYFILAYETQTTHISEISRNKVLFFYDSKNVFLINMNI